MGNVIYPLWAECPMLTRMVVAGLPALSFAVRMIASASDTSAWLMVGLFDCSIVSLIQLKFWTLLWGPFYVAISSGRAFLMVLFQMYYAMSYFPALEKEMGSTTFLLWMFLINTLTSLLYLAIMFCLFFLYDEPYYLLQSLRGLWPLLMVCFTLDSLRDPDSSTDFWGLVTIPNRWYPLALTGLFTLINGRIMWDFLVALAIGYGYPKLRLERLLPSKTRVDRLEQKCCRGGRCQLLGASWIPAVSTSSYDLDERIDERQRNFLNTDATNSTTAPSCAAGGQFVAFGGSGNRLGEASGTEMQARPATEPSGQP